MENSSAIAVLANPVITDVDAENFNNGSLIVSLSNYVTGDYIYINNQGLGAGQIGVSGNNVTYGGTSIGMFAGGSDAELVINLNSNATLAATQALALQVRYTNLSTDPTAGGTAMIRNLTVTIKDGCDMGSDGAHSASVSGVISITGINAFVTSIENHAAFTMNYSDRSLKYHGNDMSEHSTDTYGYVILDACLQNSTLSENVCFADRVTELLKDFGIE
jgi:hypothetical protein